MKREAQSAETELVVTTPAPDAIGAEGGDAEDGGADAEGGGELLLELVLAEHAARGAAQPPAPAPERGDNVVNGVVIGALVALGEAGEARVTFAGGPDEGAPARAMAALGPGDVGREVAILFEGGDPRRPVILGLMHVSGEASKRPEARVDGERLELSAEKELVLRCGKSSITLTRAGKILIRGAYLLARSSGVNRIQGGSVQIN